MLLFLIRIYVVRCGKSEMTRCELIKKINGGILSFTWKANDGANELCFKAEIYDSGFAVSENIFFIVIVHSQQAFTHYTNLQPHLTAFHEIFSLRIFKSSKICRSFSRALGKLFQLNFMQTANFLERSRNRAFAPRQLNPSSNPWSYEHSSNPMWTM